MKNVEDAGIASPRISRAEVGSSIIAVIELEIDEERVVRRNTLLI
jgi:hypothetical protein